MRDIIPYIDTVLRCVSRDFMIDLKYEGIARMHPRKRILLAPTKKKGKAFYDLAWSDVFMVEVRYRYQDQEIIKPLYLAYLREAGRWTLNGAEFVIYPQLDSDAVSVTNNQIFTRLTRTRLLFSSDNYSVYMNGSLMVSEVTHSAIHKGLREKKSSIYKALSKSKTILPHYLFGKYGVKETFKRFANCDVVIGSIKETGLSALQEKYPDTQWAVFRSFKVQNADTFLAIPSEQMNSLTRGLAVGFFYIHDLFPERFSAEFFKAEDEDDIVSEIGLWRVLLGHIIFTSDNSEGKVKLDVDEHYRSCDCYIDELVKKELKLVNWYVEDFYELLAKIITEYAFITANATGDNAGLYGKRLSVLRPFTEVITRAAFKMLFRINKLASKPKLTKDTIEKILSQFLKKELIWKNNNGSISTVSVSVSNDNYAYNITNVVVQPPSAKKGSTEHLNLSPDVLDCGSAIHLPKADPSGRSRLSQFSEITADGVINPSSDPAVVSAVEYVSKHIKK